MPVWPRRILGASRAWARHAADRAYDEDARFLKPGRNYGISEDFDIDFGLRRGLTEPETDTTLLLGIALRF